MRICYVAHSTQHYVPAYIDHFSRQGHEVHLVSLNNVPLRNAICHFPLNRPFDSDKTKLPYLMTPWRVPRMIRAIRPDLVHAHYVTSNGFLAALAGVHPLVITAHGSDLHMSARGGIRRPIARYAMKKADVVNVVSRGLRDVAEGLGVPREKTLVLTLGIETGPFLFARTVRRPGPVRIICTRRMAPVYQCDTTVRALALLAREGVRFECVFAGSGPGESALRRLAAENGLAGCTRFLGGYSLGDLPSLLADADIYVSASRWDGTSLSLLEAMVAGPFPVVSDIPANREWLVGGRDGLLFAVGSIEHQAACLQQAIDNVGLRASAVQTNRRKVLAEGDRFTNMSRLGECYERLLRR